MKADPFQHPLFFTSVHCLHLRRIRTAENYELTKHKLTRMVSQTETNSPLIEIPAPLRALVGDAEEGTRIFRREGTHEEMAEWFDAICEHVGPTVSPGGAANYAAVTRPGIYKRLRAGTMTAFCFHIIGKTKTLFGGTKKLKELAIVYIPVSECQAWRKELEQRVAKLNEGKPITPEDEAALDEADGEHTDGMHEFLNRDPKDKKKKGIRYIQ